MGLTREQIKERAIQRFKDFIKTYGEDFSSNAVKYSKKDFEVSDDNTKHRIIKVWDKEPVCAQDICVLAVVMLDNEDIIFCDMYKDNSNVDNSTIDQPERCRCLNDFTTSRINEILEDLCRLEGIESVVPARKKPEYINHYKNMEDN